MHHATKDGRVGLVFTWVEATDIITDGTAARKGHARVKGAGFIDVDDGPRQNPVIGGSAATVFARDRRGGGELDGRAAGQRRQANPAEDEGDPAGRDRLSGCLITPRRATEGQDGRTTTTPLDEADDAQAFTESGVLETFVRIPRAIGIRPNQFETTAAEGDVFVRPGRAHATVGDINHGVI